MTGRPIIFISAASKELRRARQLVANTLQLLGYEPDWQDIFSTDEGDLRGMLRRKIDAAAGVVQLVGQCYGAEPRRDEEFGRVSYTQYEALYAKRAGKKVWYLFIDPKLTDEHEAEPEELQALQSAYQERIRESGQLYHRLDTSDALEAKVLKLRDDLAQLRRRGKQWAVAVVALLIVITALAVWLVHKEGQTQQQGSRTEQRVAGLEQEMPDLLAKAVDQYFQKETDARHSAPGETKEQIEQRTYADLAKSLGIDAKTLHEELPEFARQLKRAPNSTTYQRATAAYILKEYADAEHFALQAADELKKATPPRIMEAIQALELAGWSAEQQVRYTDALSHFGSAAALTDRQREPTQWADVQNDVAYIFITQGKGQDAENILRDVVSVDERVRGREEVNTLRSRNDLAYALYVSGKFPESESEFRAVLAISERVLGAKHYDTLKIRNNLANVLIAQANYVDAEKEARAAFTIQAETLGSDDVDTLISRANVANALYSQGELAEAEKENREVLASFERVLGPDKPETLSARNNLAETLRAEGKFAESEKEARTAFTASERVLTPDNPITLLCQSTLAGALFGEEKYAEADEGFRTVLSAQERVLGRDHPDTLKTRNNVANVLMSQSKYAKAEQEFRSLLSAFENKLGPNHPYTLMSALNLANALAAQGKLAEAIGFARRGEKGLQDIGHPNYENARQLVEQIEAAQR